MDPVTMAALASAGASVFGSVMGSRSTARGQADANAANQAMAREQMAFQERMDSTKYQRGVEDARKAGFNPLVAFPGSGGSPMGASAVMHNTQPNKGELFLATSRALSELASMRADVKLKEKMAATEDTKQELNRAEADKARGNLGIFGSSLPFNRVSNWFNNGVSTATNLSTRAGKSIVDTFKSAASKPGTFPGYKK